MIRLKHAKSEDVASMQNDLIGAGGASTQEKNNEKASRILASRAHCSLQWLCYVRYLVRS